MSRRRQAALYLLVLYILLLVFIAPFVAQSNTAESEVFSAGRISWQEPVLFYESGPVEIIGRSYTKWSGTEIRWDWNTFDYDRK